MIRPSRSIAALIALALAAPAAASPSDGNWVIHADNPAAPVTAIRISSSSLNFVEVLGDGAAIGTGWWTESPWQGNTTRVILRIEDAPPENVQLRNLGGGRMEIWEADGSKRLATMARTNCSVDLTYRNKSDTPPQGCDWLHIKGWGYSGLDGECIFQDDWQVMTPEQEKAPMECLITVPIEFVK